MLKKKRTKLKPSIIQWEKKHLRIANDISLIDSVVEFIFNNIDYISKKNYFLKIGLQEILINAIEHGNLDISYAEKKELLEKGNYEALLKQRADFPEFTNRYVDIKIFSNSEYLKIIVEDMGKGFDLKTIPDPENPENFFKEGGKGILMALNAYDKVEFNEKGNVVSLIKYSDKIGNGRTDNEKKEGIETLDKISYFDVFKDEFSIELNLAAEFQRTLLPDKNLLGRFSGIRSAYIYEPLFKVSGDFIDIRELENGIYGYFIADISGHGVAAALISSMLKVFFSLYAKDLLSPQLLFEMLNQEFFHYLNLGEYFTSFYGIYFKDQKKFVYTNANHPAPVLLKKGSSDIIPLNTEGFFVGIFKDTVFEEKKVTLGKGDRILFYTDGVSESKNPSGKQFGKERLTKIFKNNSKLDISHLMDFIKKSVDEFTGKKYSDDITLAVIEID